jgi:hypothetical protein
MKHKNRHTKCERIGHQQDCLTMRNRKVVTTRNLMVEREAVGQRNKKKLLRNVLL